MMINRIVKMTFEESKVEAFQTLFLEVEPKINAFPGCKGVKLLRDIKNSNIFFTYSLWTGEEALLDYRNSELFADTWKKTKALFSQKAEAWSTEVQ